MADIPYGLVGKVPQQLRIMVILRDALMVYNFLVSRPSRVTSKMFEKGNMSAHSKKMSFMNMSPLGAQKRIQIPLGNVNFLLYILQARYFMRQFVIHE